MKTNLAIFASGAGSNAQNIINFFKDDSKTTVSLIVCNNSLAGVLQIASNSNIPTLLIEKDKFFNEDGYLPTLQEQNINFIVLAGFLWKVPSTLIKAFPQKIINIHPALLPRYGGKGMYSHYVHEAVLAANETQSGITIHYVDEVYDHGNIIFQACCTIVAKETTKSLAQKISKLEHEYYPAVIKQLLQNCS